MINLIVSGQSPRIAGVDSHPSEAVWFSGSILKDWCNYQSNEYEWPIITNVPTYQSYQEDPGGINIWQLWFSALVHSIVPTQKRRMISPPTPNLSRVYLCQKCCQKWPRPFTSWDDDSRCAKYFLGQNDQSIVQFLTRNLGRKNFLTQIYPDIADDGNWSQELAPSKIIPGIQSRYHQWINQGNCTPRIT